MFASKEKRRSNSAPERDQERVRLLALTPEHYVAMANLSSAEFTGALHDNASDGPILTITLPNSVFARKQLLANLKLLALNGDPKGTDGMGNWDLVDREGNRNLLDKSEEKFLSPDRTHLVIKGAAVKHFVSLPIEDRAGVLDMMAFGLKCKRPRKLSELLPHFGGNVASSESAEREIARCDPIIIS